jgi:replicative DNA helicase
MPHDLNAEAAILSAMMIDSYAISKVAEVLKEESFYRNAHKIIFRTIIDLFNNQIETDLITIIDDLNRKKLLEKAGGNEYLNDLSDVVLSSANVDYHIRIVEEKALLRQLINTANQIIDESYQAGAPVEDIIDNAENLIFQIAERPKHEALVNMQKLADSTMKNILEIAQFKKTTTGVASGFTDVDNKLGGFRPGQLIVIAARPAMGKTSFALNIAFNAAVLHHKKICIFTMEMESEELVMRMFASAAEVSMDSMLRGFGLDEKKILRITGVSDVLMKTEIYIDDTGTNTILDLRAKSRRLQAQIGGLDLIIIDYLQLMASNKSKDNRQQEISEISRNLKILAKELKVPIIALSQLNRGLETRTDKRPMLADLRESGAIEQDADVVMFIYREVVYNEETLTPGKADIIIGKNRHGPIDTIPLYFQKEFTKFRDAAKEEFK